MTENNLEQNVNHAPLISVVLPIYNGEKYLSEAVESILAQSLSDFELLMIDDGSSDGSLGIMQEYARRDVRIRVVTRENRGLSATLNDLIALARGKFIARMDSDDISHPERFAKQVALLEAENADICGCHWIVMNESGKYIDVKLAPVCSETTTICLAETVPFAHGSVMMRRSFIDLHSLRYITGKHSEDYDLWIRFYEKGAKFANVNDFLFMYRDYALSFSKSKRKEMAADTKMLKNRFVMRNADACLNAVKQLSNNYSSLSFVERINLLLTSYRLSIILKRPYMFDVIKYSTRRSLFLALVEILK